MKELIIYPKKGRMFLLGILSFVFVLMGATFIMIYFREEEVSLWMVIIGVLCVVFFGFCLIYYVKEIIVHKPILIISHKGIIDRSSYLGAGLVTWEEIRAVYFVEFGGQIFIGIFTHDPNLIINRSTRLQRILNQVNMKLINSQVNIPVKNLNYSTDELIKLINDYRNEDSYHVYTE